MLIKKCSRCGKLFQYNNKSLCPDCQASDDRKTSDRVYNQKFRDKRSDRFYHSAEWKRLSKIVLAKAGYKCAECGGLATEVHHVVEIRNDWNRRLDVSNLIPLCTSCHNKQRKQ